MSNIHAIRMHAYGGPEVLSYDSLPCPEPGAGELRVRVHAASVNPVDWKIRSGYVKAMFPNDPFPLIPGGDFAGVVDALGEGVSGWAVGDAVFGMAGLTGAYTQALCTSPAQIAAKPQSLDFVHAAAIPLAGLTAWQALEAAGLNAGDKLLIHGAAGGVGSFAVQIARAKGLHVTATASERNADYLRTLGADAVIDYHTTAIEAMGNDYAATLDLVGGDTAERSRERLRPGGITVVVAGRPAPSEPDAQGRRLTGVFVQPNGAQLAELGKLVDTGALRVEIAASFALREAAQAHTLSEGMHTRGKIVLRMRD